MAHEEAALANKPIRLGESHFPRRRGQVVAGIWSSQLIIRAISSGDAGLPARPARLPSIPITVRSGFRLAHCTGGIDRPPPKIGEHSAEILAEARYDADKISALRDQGVI
ncbi:MAG TPA: hypothetical protein VFQ90_04220 [Stellaceae bacterium]|nr:hypothetical protein [Stellaceae bacterium]